MKIFRATLTIALVALTVATAVAQRQNNNRWEVRKVDFRQIRDMITDPQSQCFYPRLRRALANNDTTLSYEAYRALYYGIAFQGDAYDPLAGSPSNEHLDALYAKEKHSRDECAEIEYVAEKALEKNPFDLDQMSYLVYVLKEKRKWNKAAILQRHLDRITAAILSSGKGTKQEPWTVMYVEHEYFIVNVLGYIAEDYQQSDGIDFIKVKRTNGTQNTVDGFYFDVSRIVGKTR